MAGRPTSDSTTCLRLERNQDGILYFHQPINDGEEFITRRIYPSGEAELRKRGVAEGDCLPRDLHRLFRQRDWLY